MCHGERPRKCNAPLPNPYKQISSIILRQPRETRHRLCTVEIAVPRLRRQNPRLHTKFPAPLHARFGDPSPVEPAPANLEAGHLGFGVHEEPLLVGVAVAGRVSVGVGTLAISGIGRAGWREDVAGGVIEVHGPSPAAADVDIVEVDSAVGVSLGPFATHGRAEPIDRIRPSEHTKRFM